MGGSIVLLLIFAGEIFKALRDLDTARRKRLAATHEERGHEHGECRHDPAENKVSHRQKLCEVGIPANRD